MKQKFLAVYYTGSYTRAKVIETDRADFPKNLDAREEIAHDCEAVEAIVSIAYNGLKSPPEPIVPDIWINAGDGRGLRTVKL